MLTWNECGRKGAGSWSCLEGLDNKDMEKPTVQTCKKGEKTKKKKQLQAFREIIEHSRRNFTLHGSQFQHTFSFFSIHFIRNHQTSPTIAWHSSHLTTFSRWQVLHRLWHVHCNFYVIVTAAPS
jgi:hypothetical protein